MMKMHCLARYVLVDILRTDRWNSSAILQAVTPSKARRQAEADRRREVKEQRKAQFNALEGKRGGLEKQKVRTGILRIRTTADAFWALFGSWRTP